MKKLVYGIMCFAAMAAANAFAEGTLPIGYAEVEYIQGNGSDAYIVTDYTPQPNTDKVEAVVEWPTGLDSVSTIWCSRGATTSTDSWTAFMLNDSNVYKFRLDYGSNRTGYASPFDVAANTKYTVTVEDNRIDVVGGAQPASYEYPQSASFTDGWPIMLFASYYNGTGNNLNNYGSHLLYSFKVWRSGNLIHYFVPCKDANGAATMVDICDNPATLTKSGTFAAGSEGHYYDDSLFASLAILPIPEQRCLPGVYPEPGFTVTNKDTGAFWVFAEGGVASGTPPFDVAYSFNDDVGTVTVIGKAGGEYEGETLTADYRFTDEFLVNGGFESGALAPGWTGSGSILPTAINASNGHNPNHTTTFITGTWCGMLKKTSSMQQVFTVESACRATLSWKCKHRCDWNANTLLYYKVLLDGVDIYPEETTSGSVIRDRSVEGLVLAQGEHTLRFEARTDNNADTSLFLDDISLKMVSPLVILPIPSQIYNVGDICRPEFTVSNVVNAQTWTVGGDIVSQYFDVEYTNNAAPGIATAIVTGKAGSLYEGASSEEEFVIYRTIYVNPSAADHVEPYATRETGAATLADAIACANASNWAAKIVMAAGSYTGSGYTLSTPILVVGETGDPKDVSITDNSSSTATGSRAFLISHPFAGLSALTIRGYGLNGSANNNFCGGHVNMSAGVVDNCVITGGRGARSASGGWGRGSGGNVYMSGGRLTRSKITGGQTVAWKQSSDVDSRRSYGGGVYATGDAVVDSCLIYGNGNATITYGGGVCLDGRAVMSNSTIADNTTDPAYPGAGVCIYSADARVVNCVMYGNGGTAKAEFGTANLGKYMCCASSVTNESCATWYLMDESAFMGYLVQDFRHNPSSPLTDHGTVSAPYDDPIATDFFGNPRKSGPAYDIGYYEIDQSRISCSALPSTYGYFVGSNITFTASAVGGSGGYLYRFDFGNGVTVDTANAACTYAYPAAGLYTARVAASDDGGNTWSAWADVPTKIAIVPAVMYVNSANASPEYPYDTPAKAAKKIADCLVAMTNNASANLGTVDGGTIRVLAGTHTEAGIKLACGVTVRGDTGNPADVVIRDNTNSGASGTRAFTITHAGAVVSDLTISGYGLNGSANNNFCGGHVNMSAGVVDNCVITGGRGSRAHAGGWGQGSGGNVYMSGGRLTRSKITGGQAIVWKQSKDEDSRRSYGGGVYATGDAVVDSCLIYGNGSATITYGGGICLAGSAVAVNCTVIGNTTDPTYPGAGICIYGANANAKAVNCVLYDNGGTAKAEFGTANLGKYMCCASSVTNESCETWYLIGDSDFAGYSVQDFHANPSSSLVNHGTTDGEWYPAGAGTLDFDGNPRVSGSSIDIGCYEVDQSSVSCSGIQSTYAYFVGSNITFTASAIGGSGSFIFRWDFGNGVTVTAPNTDYSYAYPAAGLYTVRVAASDDGGASWCDWTEVSTKTVVVPAVMYVDSANASPEYPYDTPAKAARKIADCLLAMTNNASANLGAVDGGTIRVLAGTHAETGIKLACGVTVRGDTGNPADVVVNDSVDGSRAFTMSHAGAVVRDLTVSGTGYRTSIYGGEAVCGGHINVSAGTVENCIVTGGYGAGTHQGGWGRGFGGNVYLSGGRLTRSKITAGHGAGHMSNVTDEGHTGRGGGVCAEGAAVVDSCLIYANGNESRTLGGGIYLGGSAVAVNCTIVDNTTGTGVSGSGLYMASSNAKAVNCVIFGNGGTEVAEFGGVNLDRFAYGASSVTNESCATWKVIDEKAFRDWSRRAEDVAGLRPRNGGALVDAGSTGAEYEACGGTATEDLRGYERISGRRLDIGCYASRPRGSVYYLR